MSETVPITIEVDARVARMYSSATKERRRKLDALLSLKLSEAILAERPLEAVLHEMSQKALERGLTPEKLDQILREG